ATPAGSHMRLSELASYVSGKLIGEDKEIKVGIFNTLGDANPNDIVIRHWIDEKGVEIAKNKEVSALITQNPKGNSLEYAKKLKVPIILVNKIELASAFAIKWTIKNFAPNTYRVVITGTNGKSTTTHMIYHILTHAGKKAFTNTDAKSEFNTLIDPMVAKLLAEKAKKENLEYLVIEVSEVQGWLDRLMKDHAYLMTKSINPNVVVVTNVALDHIGLVNSIEEVFEETSGAVKALEKGFAVLNYDNEFTRKMAKLTNKNVKVFFYGKNCPVTFKSGGIYVNNDLFIKKEELPFKSEYFIQNTLAAISACLCLNIPPDIIKKGILTYKPLKRRFSILCKKPLIIDDFAHNPDGIKMAIKSAKKLTKNKLWVVCAIRGSRGKIINKLNAESLSKTLKNIENYEVVITNSDDVVDNLNKVKKEEEKTFLKTLEKYNINYRFHKKLKTALEETLTNCKKDDTILLIGAQGMDPASKLLKKIKVIPCS
uniref:Mur ligase middle domain protein n=1 Tax=Methanothermus fervidus TaxID=2180 RepID=UPI001C6872CD|nr:Chain I, Mur ligase middle domain protein [Methanothermus fervidus]7JT8_I Chain I, Mur ligase middle domain protein [Methanothermus fervidus DSM 2088]